MTLGFFSRSVPAFGWATSALYSQCLIPRLLAAFIIDPRWEIEG